MTLNLGKSRVSSLRIREATSDDIPAIVDFMRVCLGEGQVPRSEAYWRWKHIDNPFGVSPVLLACADAQIVGLRAFMRWTWHCGGQQVHAVRAVDTATHPEWRGQGIFTRLTQQLADQVAENGTAFIFNTPNEKSRPGYLKMGWEFVGRIPLWVQPRRPVQLSRALLRGDARMDAVPTDCTALRSIAALLSEPWLPAFLRALAQRSGPGFTTPRSVDYLRWRYEAIPGLDYRTTWIREGEATAIIILRIVKRGALRELRIVECMASGTGDGRKLATAALREASRATHADYAVGVATGRSTHSGSLVRAGYIPIPAVGPHFTVRRLNPAAVDPAQMQHWDLSAGDIELF